MPDTSTEVAIATTTLGSASSTITFSSISSAYTDLRLVFVPTSSAGAAAIKLRYNGDTAANFSFTQFYGSGSVAGSQRSTSVGYIELGLGAPDLIPALYTVDLFSYAGSTYKTCLITENQDLNGSGWVTASVGLWRSTAAITSLTIFGNTYSAGTTATLYGIL